MAIKIAINGFGRIGRATFKSILKNHPHLEVVAINDLTSPGVLAHLLKYDSIYGAYEKVVKFDQENLIINGQKIKVLSEENPAELPWKSLKIDIVLECTGVFRDLKGAQQHIKAGAKKVIISAPAKGDNIPCFVLGANEEKYNPEKDNIVDMGSCTSNCLTPIVEILDRELGIISGSMTTVHSYTNDQKILDLPHKDLRRARAAGMNIILTSTGAITAVERIYPHLKGKLNGLAIRVPTPVVSVIDLVCNVKKETNAQEVNYFFKKASGTVEYRNILGIEDALLVSTDYVGNTYSAIVDAESTKVINNNLVKVLAWYDNEWAYSCRLAEFAEFIGRKL
ncbi:MAG: type I glyceraldehyde-3-phosphate dehydrogenase [Patescibacteria group bacterium]|nr:type I glyceraldehyde-3-phosphate dehydrogenase [Patescibacteria group bacterium]MBU1877078.1 type I glyceraldehyde-3-phosphate dehydrogenase [Patescibacteria group bacterium]